jgi:hypothetical protein
MVRERKGNRRQDGSKHQGPLDLGWEMTKVGSGVNAKANKTLSLGVTNVGLGVKMVERMPTNRLYLWGMTKVGLGV